ncbi:hypothetical protein [Enterobacter hormaechei]
MNRLLTPSEYFRFIEEFDHYFPAGMTFHSLLSQFNMKIEEIVIFHRFVINTHNKNKISINSQHDKFKILSNQEIEKLSEDEQYFYERAFCSHMENCRAKESLNNNVFFIANDSVVINTWAIVEQYMTRGLACLISKMENKNISDVVPPYKWNSIQQKFLSYGIDFNSLPSYDDINECRVLNNKIKHLNIVDSALEKFPSFSGKLNMQLFGMNYPLQKYILAAHHFIGMLLEECSQK